MPALAEASSVPLGPVHPLGSMVDRTWLCVMQDFGMSSLRRDLYASEKRH